MYLYYFTSNVVVDAGAVHPQVDPWIHGYIEWSGQKPPEDPKLHTSTM